jgi:hypothetical protein
MEIAAFRAGSVSFYADRDGWKSGTVDVTLNQLLF